MLQIVAPPFYLQVIKSAEQRDRPVEHHQVPLHKSKLAWKASGHRSGLQMHPVCSELADHALIDTLTPVLDLQGQTHCSRLRGDSKDVRILTITYCRTWISGICLSGIIL